MFTQSSGVEVIGADRVGGGLLVHFSNGTSTLFQAHFLFDMRNENGNVPIGDEGGADD